MQRKNLPTSVREFECAHRLREKSRTCNLGHFDKDSTACADPFSPAMALS